MRCRRYGLILLALVPLFVFVLGCDKSQQQAGDTDLQARKSELNEIYNLYTLYVKINQKPPQRVTDLTQKEQQATSPAGVRVLQSDEYVVVWGADLTSRDGAVLAYQKSVPNEGGWVLLRDGSIKQLTADEFKATPKAK
jgi:hypothetical protein